MKLTARSIFQANKIRNDCKFKIISYIKVYAIHFILTPYEFILNSYWNDCTGQTTKKSVVNYFDMIWN